MEIQNTSGRRKTSVARVYLKPGKGNILVNDKDYKVYFPTLVHQYRVTQPLLVTENLSTFDINVNVTGGGITGQADAVKLAISKALCEHNQELRAQLKPLGLLTRDSRMVERKKPGQKKARKRFQFSKR